MAEKRYYISEFQENQEIECALLVSEKELRTARNGNAFLTLKLTDRSGQITGRVWQEAEAVDARIPTGAVVMVQARSECYRNQLQLQIRHLTVVDRDQVDPVDFLPRCPEDPEKLWQQFQELVGSLERRSFKKLLVRFQADSELVSRYRLAPAAKNIHHAYLGGLLEHSVAVAGLLDRICAHYDSLRLDRDLLITAALLHDIGKVEEYRYDLVIDYSDVGRLIGHMVLGWQMIEKMIRDLAHFPATDEVLLNHLILSHHGEAEFGAVRMPMTREAFLLHFADDLDAKMHHLSRLLAADADDSSCWTRYQPLYGRYLFKGWQGRQLAEAPSCRDLSTQPERGRQLSVWSLLQDSRGTSPVGKK